MRRQRRLLAATTFAIAAAALAANATAAPSTPSARPTTTFASTPQPQRPRGSLRLEIAEKKPWVGQRVPVTVTAYFRGVDAVTLEGPPQLESNAIVTSELARDAKQATQILDGVPTLVVRWSGTVTPSVPGAIDLSVSMPVRLRYHEAIARERSVDPFGDEDPFGGFGWGDDVDALFDRMRSRMRRQLEGSAGRRREVLTTLKASLPRVEAAALPGEGRPSPFTGAVGTFDISATASSSHVRQSEPVTLRIAVEGSVDPDRVDVLGVPASEDWKVYPARVATRDEGEPSHRKVFEQVLVPLRGGDATIPAVSFAAFDPASGRYVTKSTSPIAVRVDGAPAATDGHAAELASAPATSDAAANEPVALAAPRDVVMATLPALGVVALAALWRIVEGTRRRTALRSAMRSAASSGSTHDFLCAARRFVAATLAKRWGVAPDGVTAPAIRERLGERGATLADVLVADDALRFGRAEMDRADLRRLCASIEQSLRGAA